MGWFSKDPIQEACKSDSFSVLSKAVGNDEGKYKKAVKYLKSKGNLNLLLKLQVIPVGRQDLIETLMHLDQSDPQVHDEINRLGADGVAPIHLYSTVPNNEIFIRLLANSGADMDLEDANGVTPLIIAASAGLTETVQMLLNNGARAVNKSNSIGWTPLHFACQLARPEIVAMLIEEKADINPISKDGFMPIHVAISTHVYSKHSEVSPSGKEWDPKDALMCAQLLVNHNADLEYKCAQGFAAKDVLVM